MRFITLAAALFLSSTLVSADEPHEWCGTASPSAELAGPFLDRLAQSEPRFLPKASNQAVGEYRPALVNR